MDRLSLPWSLTTCRIERKFDTEGEQSLTEFGYDEDKFVELLLYVAKSLKDDPAGGAVKLNKVLFFAEFAHVRAHGRPITGAEFQKLRHGPAPRRLVPVRDELLAAGQARVELGTYLGYRQDRLVPLREPDLEALTSEELEIVDQVLHELRGRTGAEASDLSHEEMGFRLVEEGETIPFTTAYLRPPVVSERMRRHAAKLAEELEL